MSPVRRTDADIARYNETVMLTRLFNAIADYTFGTAIVLVHLSLADRNAQRLLAARAR